MSTEQPTLEERAEHLAGGIYGTIVVAGLLAATGPDDDPQVADTALWVVITMVVFWLAHSWSLSMARRAAGMPQGEHSLGTSLKRNWPLVQSAFAPVAVMFLAVLAGSTDENAILIGGWSCVVLLAGWGVIVGRREHESTLRIVLTSLGCAALGGLMILLKIFIH